MIDCLVIGGGPAGLTAGIYLRRFHRSVTIVDNDQSRARRIPLAHNYPGFPDGISGIDLLERMRRQLENHGATLTQGEVTSLTRNEGHGFSARFNDTSITASTVLLATGGSDVEPELPGYQMLKESGLIRFCPICDGFEFTDHHIAIIGSDAHGVREYDFMKNFSRHLSYISLKNATETARDVAGNPTAENNVLNGVGSRLRREPANEKQLCLETADGKTHHFNVIYCALGSKVHSRLARDLGARHDDRNGLVVNEKLETSVPGLYASGDVVSGLDQLSVATGQAAIAATAIHNRLRDGSEA